ESDLTVTFSSISTRSKPMDAGTMMLSLSRRRLPEFVKRAQIIRPWLIFVGLRPIGPRYFANIKVAVAVNRKPVRRQEFGRAKAGTKPAQSGNTLAAIIDDGHPRAEIGHIAVDRLHRAEFADVANGALAGRHEQAARPMQVVPLGLVFAVAIEHLHAMVLAI